MTTEIEPKLSFDRLIALGFSQAPNGEFYWGFRHDTKFFLGDWQTLELFYKPNYGHYTAYVHYTNSTKEKRFITRFETIEQLKKLVEVLFCFDADSVNTLRWLESDPDYDKAYEHGVEDATEYVSLSMLDPRSSYLLNRRGLFPQELDEWNAIGTGYIRGWDTAFNEGLQQMKQELKLVYVEDPCPVPYFNELPKFKQPTATNDPKSDSATPANNDISGCNDNPVNA